MSISTHLASQWLQKNGGGIWLKKMLLSSSHLQQPTPSSLLGTIFFSCELYPELTGHFPHQSIVPAVYCLEGMYQTALCYQLNQKSFENVSWSYPSLHKARFMELLHVPCEVEVHVQTNETNEQEEEEEKRRFLFHGDIYGPKGILAASASFSFSLNQGNGER